MSALARAAEFLVTPVEERAPARPVAASGTLSVLGPARDAVPVAATLGPLIAVWNPGLPHVVAAQPPQREARPPHVSVAQQHQREARPLAAPAAARLARWASDRGHDAVARGRAAHVTLAADPRHASAEASRLAASATTRVVTVLAGPRHPAFDAFLAEQDRVLVVTRPETDPDLVALTLASLGAHASAVPALTGPSRLLAAAGWLRRDPAALEVPA